MPEHEILKPDFVDGDLPVLSDEAQFLIKARLLQCCAERKLDGWRVLHVKPTAKWLAIEREFLIGVNTCLQVLSGGDIFKVSSQIPPIWVICMQTGRSILE